MISKRPSGQTMLTVAAGIGLAGAMAASLVGCGDDASTRTSVSMLWFGQQADGSIAYGVTPVEVRARNTNEAGFDIDLTGTTKAGDEWRTAAWSAAAVGTLLAATDPRGTTISFDLRESIDGPSAGAVLTVGVLGDLLAGGVLDQNVTMTGTVLPSGAIGPVGGIPAKIQAAAEAGISTVLIPTGQRISVDPDSGRRVDVVDTGAQLGLAVVEVASVQQAYDYFVESDRADLPPTAPTGLDQALTDVFNSATDEALARIGTLNMEQTPTPELESERRRIATGLQLALSRIAELRAEERLVEAFARATLAERAVLSWNAQTRAYAAAITSPAETLNALRADAAQLQRDADAAIDRGSRIETAFIEQVTALPDALCWGVDAWAAAAAAQAELRGAATPATPATAAAAASAAASLTSARYDLATYLPFSLDALATVGRTPASDYPQAYELLDVYADLLAAAGDAATAHVRLNAEIDEASAARILEQRWQEQPAGSDPASITARLSSAMAYYVAASTLVATEEVVTTATEVQGSSRFDRTAWTNQVDVASGEIARSTTALLALDVDPGYLVWNEGFGRTVAIAADAIGADDDVRLGGLQVQWYGTVQGRLLTTLAATGGSD